MLKHEITHVGGVVWEGAFVQLAEVLGRHEQLDRAASSEREKQGERRPKNVRGKGAVNPNSNWWNLYKYSGESE